MMQKYFAAVFLIFASILVFLVVIDMPVLQAVVINVHPILHIGLGAILIREAVVRWNKGLASMILLGAAYALILEGIGFQGVFNPRFIGAEEMDLAGFGHWGGINWIWALGTTVVHIVFNIAVPITFVNALFPDTAGRLDGKILVLLLFVFLADTVYLILVPSYHPPRGALAVMMILIFLSIAAARFSPQFSLSKKVALPHDAELFVSGLVGTIIFFFVYRGFHSFIHNPLLNVVTMLCVLALFCLLLLELPDLPPHSKVALAAGIFCVPIIVAVLKKSFLRAVVAFAVVSAAWIKSKRAGATS